MYEKKIKFILKNQNLYLLSLLILWYLFLGQKFINEPFVWDDLNLIRKYSNAELLSVWSTSWDPYGFETPAFRPLAAMFYHVQGSIFGEHVQSHRIFIFSLFYLLLILIVKLLNKLNFSKIEILLISILLIFSKIFTTLASWMTMSHLIFCYILLSLCLINYLNWLEKNKIISLFLAILFGISSILTREEVYFIPAIIFLTGLFFSEFTKKNIIKIFLTSSLFFVLVIIHYYLRDIFLKGDGPQITFDTIRFRSFLSHLLQSGMPSGFFSFEKKITFLQFIWLLLIFFISLILVINIKKISIKDKKNILILILISAAASTSSLIAARAFGIFIPSIFSLALIVRIFFICKKNSEIFFNKNFLSKNFNLIIMLLIISGISGGYIRSSEHLKAMNKYSIYIVAYDTQKIFEKVYVEKEGSIPEIRKIRKRKFLKDLGITEYLTLNQIKEKINKNEISNKIFTPRFHPLSPNFNIN